LGLVKLTPHKIILGFYIKKYEMCGARGTLEGRKEDIGLLKLHGET
jgi:hypothetical protein